MEPKTHKYFSIPAKYSGSTVEDLELSIQKYAGLASLYYGCILAVSEKNAKIHQAHILYPALLWLVLAFKIVRNTLDLVHSEKIFYSWDMALQTETVRTFGRKSVFCVQRGHLHDIVLNEVIENLDIKYMLILRTKGSMFNQRPIIPLFNSLSPSFECLKQIHRILHGYWLNNNLNKAKKDSRA